MNHPSRTPLISLAIALSALGCAKKATTAASVCADTQLGSGAGTSGQATVFDLDPMNQSGNPNLSPTSTALDSYLTPVTLSRLGGQGVLEGQYVDVRNGTSCNQWFGAQDPSNQFIYNHEDSRFQEAMAYFYGDTYRASLDQIGYLIPTTPVRIVAHCMQDDNSYYSRSLDQNGNITEFVCLGDSVATPGASYADDAAVTVHELQHATTIDGYSTQVELG